MIFYTIQYIVCFFTIIVFLCAFAYLYVCALADGLSAGQPNHCDAVNAVILPAQLYQPLIKISNYMHCECNENNWEEAAGQSCGFIFRKTQLEVQLKAQLKTDISVALFEDAKYNINALNRLKCFTHTG